MTYRDGRTGRTFLVLALSLDILVVVTSYSTGSSTPSAGSSVRDLLLYCSG